MLAFSSSTCVVIAARSCAIACNCDDSADGAAAGGVVAAGAAAYLPKPFSAGGFTDLVEKVLRP